MAKGKNTLPRGIAPDLLVSQVRNTMPYLFAPEPDAFTGFPPADRVRAYAAGAASPEVPEHFDYFALCLSSHYLSCGTPVPTDVDNQIRKTLWPAALPLATAIAMADFVLASRKWDFTLVSSRFVRGAAGTPWERETLSGHLGEWFTVACGAYAAFGRYGEAGAAKREELRAAIGDEVNRHSEIFGSLWRAQDGVGCLKASSSIAHNFGDLDRVMDMWELGPGDPLRLAYYKLGAKPFDTEGKLRYLGRLWVAGELYKSKIDGSSMAIENHRHFALRKPRGLRARPAFVVPTAPFFDEWGAAIADAEDAPELFVALAEAWTKQPGTFAYGRGLAGMLARRPELRDLPETKPAVEAAMAGFATRAVLETSREVFERRWGAEALRLMEDIPSRADEAR